MSCTALKETCTVCNSTQHGVDANVPMLKHACRANRATTALPLTRPPPAAAMGPLRSYTPKVLVNEQQHLQRRADPGVLCQGDHHQQRTGGCACWQVGRVAGCRGRPTLKGGWGQGTRWHRVVAHGLQGTELVLSTMYALMPAAHSGALTGSAALAASAAKQQQQLQQPQHRQRGGGSSGSGGGGDGGDGSGGGSSNSRLPAATAARHQQQHGQHQKQQSQQRQR